jgi:hypothetical protein
MVGWAFEPAAEEILVNFISKGRADAEAWALKSGAHLSSYPGNLVASYPVTKLVDWIGHSRGAYQCIILEVFALSMLRLGQ